MTVLSPHLRQATAVVAARGDGVRLYGEDGRRSLDFTAAIGGTSTGHCHLGKRLRHGLATVAERTLANGDVRGLGLMLVIEDGGPDTEAAARVQRAAVDEDPLVLLFGAWNQAVCVIPSLAIDETAVDEGLQGWATAVEVGTSGASR